MGTRSGDLDPSIVEFLGHEERMEVAEIHSLLNKQSGPLDISGPTSDMRELLRGISAEIGREGSRMRAFVIPTHEELLIARDTVRVLEGASPAS